MKLNPIKVVVDTNIFINAFFHKDKSAQSLLRYYSQGKIKFYFNKETHNELHYIFGEMIEKLIKNNTANLLGKFGDMMYDVERIEHITKTNYVEDKSDNKFIDCCIDGNIKYLISQDIHVENVRDFQEKIKNDYGLEINILSPFQFTMEMLKIKFLSN